MAGTRTGRILTGYCLEVAKRWGLKQVVAETSKDNHRMIGTFRNHGFQIDEDQEEDVVLVSKTIE